MNFEQLPQLRDEVGKENKRKSSSSEGELLSREVPGTAGGHPRNQRNAQRQSAEKSANVRMVVDTNDTGEVGADADDQVQNRELDDRTAKTVQLEGRDRKLFVREQHDQDAGDPEDRTGGAGADRLVTLMPHAREEAEQVAGDARDHIDRDQAEWAKQRFAKQTEVPQTPHVGRDMEQPNMDKGRGEQTVPLTVQNPLRVGRAEVKELVSRWTTGRHAMKNHVAEDEDIDSEQDVGTWGGQDVPSALAGVGTVDLALVVRDRRSAAGVRWKNFALRWRGGGHCCSSTLSKAGKSWRLLARSKQ